MIFYIFDVCRRFLHVFEVLEAREALQKLPGGDTQDSTVYEPVATLKTSNRLIFYVFRPPFRPTGSSIPALFVEKCFFDEGSDPVRPIPQDPHQNSAQNDVLASSPSFFLDPFGTKTLFLFQTILS